MDNVLLIAGGLAVLLGALAAGFVCLRRRRHAAPAASAYLHCMESTGVVSYPLTGEVANIGRDPDNDIVLPYPGVSRFHARIRQDSHGGYFLSDKTSTNHTYIRRGDDEMARVTKPTPLEPGVMIKIGGLQIQFSLDPAPYNPNAGSKPTDATVPDACRRRSRRKPISVPVRFFHEKVGWQRGTAGNVSTQGMFVRTITEPLGAGSDIEIIFPQTRPGGTRWLRFPATLVHSSTYGFGVRFRKLDSSSREVIRGLDRAA